MKLLLDEIQGFWGIYLEVSFVQSIRDLIFKSFQCIISFYNSQNRATLNQVSVQEKTTNASSKSPPILIRQISSTNPLFKVDFFVARGCEIYQITFFNQSLFYCVFTEVSIASEEAAYIQHAGQ